jgi:hypothetical protein
MWPVATDTRRTTTSRTLFRESTATRAVITVAALTTTSHSTSDADHRPVRNAYHFVVNVSSIQPGSTELCTLEYPLTSTQLTVCTVYRFQSHYRTFRLKTILCVSKLSTHTIHTVHRTLMPAQQQVKSVREVVLLPPLTFQRGLCPLPCRRSMSSSTFWA